MKIKDKLRTFNIDVENIQPTINVANYTEMVIKKIVKKDDECTKQVIKDYARAKYPNHNLRIDFLDEDIVNQIIDLGIDEYKKRLDLK